MRYRKRYAGFGPTLACEKLLEEEKIAIGVETLRRLLLEEGDWILKRKRKTHRKWRERKEHAGELIQMDGSHHDWLEGRGPRMVLMAYIDDATGQAFGRFYEYEGTIPAMDSFREYVRQNGLPRCIYFDKHSTYKSQGKTTLEEELLGKEESLSQFGRALNELGVDFIHAHSPQAKGRIERLFGTFQDRLVKEMRLANVSSLLEANCFIKGYLPKFNKKFQVLPKSNNNLHRKVYSKTEVDKALSIRTERSLHTDGTFVYKTQWYQKEIPIHPIQKPKRIQKPKTTLKSNKGHPPSRNNSFRTFEFSKRDFQHSLQENEYVALTGS